MFSDISKSVFAIFLSDTTIQNDGTRERGNVLHAFLSFWKEKNPIDENVSRKSSCHLHGLYYVMNLKSLGPDKRKNLV